MSKKNSAKSSKKQPLDNCLLAQLSDCVSFRGSSARKWTKSQHSKCKRKKLFRLVVNNKKIITKLATSNWLAAAAASAAAAAAAAAGAVTRTRDVKSRALIICACGIGRPGPGLAAASARRRRRSRRFKNAALLALSNRARAYDKRAAYDYIRQLR